MILLCVFLCFLASLQGHAVTIGPVADLVIVNKDISPDGFTRSAVLAGGVHPGPTISAQKNDTFKINVINQLNNHSMLTGTTIHWHGINQHRSNQMDGTAFVTQCPIAPGHSFLYQFHTGAQAGTFWYHSHYGVQSCDGLRGPLIIYDPDDPYGSLYDIDDESTIITLTDWYHLPTPEVPEPANINSVLINGVGRYVGGPDLPFVVINVQPLKRYRFRLLNMACKSNYIFSIDDHYLTVIEVDGEYVQPMVVNSIQIYAGQRYSFILEANQPPDNYWLHANPDAGGNATAILRYTGSPSINPKNRTTPNSISLNETSLHPLTPPWTELQRDADIKLDLVVGFNQSHFLFYINGVQYIPPTVPVLLQILSGAMTVADLLPNGTVYTLPKNKVVDITFNTDTAAGGPHPFHLHGHTFAVIRSAGSSAYNYANPVIRDTVSAGKIGDRTTIRFITNNPGPWMLHCHIDWHLYTGFALVFAEDPQDVAQLQPFNNASKALCPIYNSLPPEQYAPSS